VEDELENFDELIDVKLTSDLGNFSISTPEISTNENSPLIMSQIKFPPRSSHKSCDFKMVTAAVPRINSKKLNKLYRHKHSALLYQELYEECRECYLLDLPGFKVPTFSPSNPAANTVRVLCSDYELYPPYSEFASPLSPSFHRSNTSRPTSNLLFLNF